MPESHPSPAHLRTALFVDFDNIYLGLQREDPVRPSSSPPIPRAGSSGCRTSCPTSGRATARRRKILFRRCYLNPSQFGRFRPYFTRSAFEVVDCPPLTSGGKTSADIQMVMDILDALGHATRFDEFILLSGDADFTPVLLRLSKHDRRSAILAVGPASVAYKAACDLLIDQDTFLEEAIGATPAQSTRAADGPATTTAMQRAAAPDRRQGLRAGERRAASWWRPSCRPIFREFPEFTASTNWLGFNSLRNMTSAVAQMRRDLEMVDGDPWRVRLGDEGEPATARRRREPGADPGRHRRASRPLDRSPPDRADPRLRPRGGRRLGIGGAHGARGTDGDQPLRRAGAHHPLGRRRHLPRPARGAREPRLRHLVAQARLPLRPRAPPAARRRPPRGDGGRPGAGLARLPRAPAHRHPLPDAAASTPGSSASPPRRSTTHGYFLTRTSKAVRDRCIEEGSPIARASVNFILRGITFGGHRFGQNGGEDPLNLGSCFFRNVLSLCDSAGISSSTRRSASGSPTGSWAS